MEEYLNALMASTDERHWANKDLPARICENHPRPDYSLYDIVEPMCRMKMKILVIHLQGVLSPYARYEVSLHIPVSSRIEERSTSLLELALFLVWSSDL